MKRKETNETEDNHKRLGFLDKRQPYDSLTVSSRESYYNGTVSYLRIQYIAPRGARHLFPLSFSLRYDREFSFPQLIVVPLSCHEVDGVRKEKERLTAAQS